MHRWQFTIIATISSSRNICFNAYCNIAGTLAAEYYAISTLYCVPTSVNEPDGEGLGICGGRELYEKRLKEVFNKVERIAKDFGLYFLCSK